MTNDPLLRLVYLEILHALPESDGWLPADPESLSDILLLPSEDISRCLPILFKMGENGRGGLYLSENLTLLSNRRLQDQLNEEREYRAHKAEAGRQGGGVTTRAKSRAAKKNGALGGRPPLEPKQNPSRTEAEPKQNPTKPKPSSSFSSSTSFSYPPSPPPRERAHARNNGGQSSSTYRSEFPSILDEEVGEYLENLKCAVESPTGYPSGHLGGLGGQLGNALFGAWKLGWIRPVDGAAVAPDGKRSLTSDEVLESLASWKDWWEKSGREIPDATNWIGRGKFREEAPKFKPRARERPRDLRRSSGGDDSDYGPNVFDPAAEDEVKS